MTPDFPTSPLHGPGPVDGLRHGTRQQPDAAPTDGASGARFEALLERLQAQARALDEDSKSVDSPVRLADAVDRARHSLEDAMALRDRLLEAFHEARVQPPAGDAAPLIHGMDEAAGASHGERPDERGPSEEPRA